jgi:hypothetical protein
MEMLLATAEHLTGEEGLLRVRIYRSAVCATDLGPTLSWESNFSNIQGSRTGFAISDTLKTFGLVEYSTWVEQNADGSGILLPNKVLEKRKG